MARIELRKRGAIGEIRLNRPEVLNAQGRDWPADLLAAAAEMQKDASVRVVLVTGEGRSFCSGLDLTQLAQGDITVDWFHRAELALPALETMDKVVIAGVQGHCIGGRAPGDHHVRCAHRRRRRGAGSARRAGGLPSRPW